MDIVESIQSLCDEKGIKITQLEKILGYGHSSLSRAKSIGHDRVEKIAQYFGVSTDRVIYGPNTETKFEKSLKFENSMDVLKRTAELYRTKSELTVKKMEVSLQLDRITRELDDVDKELKELGYEP